MSGKSGPEIVVITETVVVSERLASAPPVEIADGWCWEEIIGLPDGALRY